MGAQLVPESEPDPMRYSQTSPSYSQKSGQDSYIGLHWAGSRSQIQEDIIFLHLALSFEGSQINGDSTDSILFLLVLEAATQSTRLLLLSSEVLILLAIIFSLFSKLMAVQHH